VDTRLTKDTVDTATPHTYTVVSGGVVRDPIKTGRYYDGMLLLDPVAAGGSTYSGSYKTTQFVYYTYEKQMSYAWNGTANTVEKMYRDGSFSFSVSENVGGAYLTIFNAADVGTPEFEGRGTHGFYIQGTTASIYEANVDFPGSPVLPAHTQATVYKIRRDRAVVTYYVDDVLVYTSAVLTNEEPQLLYAELYASYDFVLLGGVVNFSVGDVGYVPYPDELPSGVIFESALPSTQVYWAARAGLAAATNPFFVTLPEMAVIFSDDRPMSCDITLPTTEIVFSDRPYAHFSATLPGLTARLRSSQVDELHIIRQGFDVVCPLPTVYFTATESYSSIEFDLPRTSIRMGTGTVPAQFGYIDEPLELPARFRVYFDNAYGPNEYGMYEILGATPVVTPVVVFFVQITEGLDIGEALTVTVLLDEAILAQLDVSSTEVTLSEIMHAVMTGKLRIGEAATTTALQELQYAVNLATGALTTYRGFDFTGFVQLDGITYASRDDGIYILREGDDNGATRDASIDFGDFDFGGMNRKNVESLYLGLDSDGTVYAKLTADGTETVYTVSQTSPTARVIAGRGAQARRWGLRLDFVAVTDLRLDNVEYSIALADRRRMP